MSVLVYHGTPTLYPEQGAASSSTGDGAPGIAAIRFPRPVRLKSLRVIPAGVAHATGVGETDTHEFTADVLLNVAPSEPVNALARTSVQVYPAPHSLDFALDMPEDTTTRLVVLRAPARRMTVSLYAYEDASLPGPDPCSALAALSLSEGTELPLPEADSLLAALPSISSADDDTRRRYFETVALVAQTPALPLERILQAKNALELTQPGAEVAAESILGLELEGDEDVDPCQALDAVLRLPSDPWSLDYPQTTPAFSTVLHLANVQRDSLHPRAPFALATVLQRLSGTVDPKTQNGHANEHADRRRAAESLLARTLPPLAAHANARGASATLAISPDMARTVVSSLLPLLADVTVDGVSCAHAARELAQPYLPSLPPNDPLRTAWAPQAYSPSIPALQVEGIPQHPRTLLDRALDAPTSSLVLSVTPADILAAVAPCLLGSLSTARVPPLGIPIATVDAQGSASDYAGKVYSAHEFRRERDTVSGLGVGTSSAGRKASRHVDEFGN